MVIVAPLVRLTNRARVRIEDIGPPSGGGFSACVLRCMRWMAT